MPLLHENALGLNSGGNTLAYLIEGREIRKIWLPHFLCDSVRNICLKYNVEIKYYHLQQFFLPEEIMLEQDEWLYTLNYYGQLRQTFLQNLVEKYQRVIIDNAQSYFADSIPNIDTIYMQKIFWGFRWGIFVYKCKVK